MLLNKNTLWLIIFIFSKQAIAAETLEQVFADALNKNQLIQASKLDTQVSESQLFAAKGLYLPNVTIQSGYTQLNEEPSAKTEFVSFATAQSGNFNFQALVSIPIYTSGKIEHTIEAAKANRLATQHNEVTTALNIKLKVANSFIAIVRTQQELQVSQSHVDNLKAHLKDVNNLYEQGMIARNDLLAAEVELSNAKQSVIQKDNQLNIAKARFNQLLNRNLNDKVDLTEAFPESSTDNLQFLIYCAMQLSNSARFLCDHERQRIHKNRAELAVNVEQFVMFVEFNLAYLKSS